MKDLLVFAVAFLEDFEVRKVPINALEGIQKI